MNNTELAKIEALEMKLKVITQELSDLKRGKWKPTSGAWCITRPGGYLDGPDSGAWYQTSTLAKWASKELLPFTLLLAYVAEFDVDNCGNQWVPDWLNYDQPKCNIEVDSSLVYGYARTFTRRRSLTVYMSEGCAKELILKLEAGDVVLGSLLG